MLTKSTFTCLDKYYHLELCLAGNLSLMIFLSMMFSILHHIKENYKYVKLAKLKDIVETTIVQAASRQASGYDYGSDIRTFGINNRVWLFLPCQRKLGSKWQGG